MRMDPTVASISVPVPAVASAATTAYAAVPASIGEPLLAFKFGDGLYRADVLRAQEIRRQGAHRQRGGTSGAFTSGNESLTGARQAKQPAVESALVKARVAAPKKFRTDDG